MEITYLTLLRFGLQEKSPCFPFQGERADIIRDMLCRGRMCPECTPRKQGRLCGVEWSQGCRSSCAKAGGWEQRGTALPSPSGVLGSGCCSPGSQGCLGLPLHSFPLECLSVSAWGWSCLSGGQSSLGAVPPLQCDSWGDSAQLSCGPLSSPPRPVHAPRFAAAMLLLSSPSQLKQQQAQDPSDEAGFLSSVTLRKIIAPPEKPSVCQVWQWRQCPVTHQRLPAALPRWRPVPSLHCFAGLALSQPSGFILAAVKGCAGHGQGLAGWWEQCSPQCSSLAAAVDGQGWSDFSHISCGCSIAQEKPSAEIMCEKTEYPHVNWGWGWEWLAYLEFSWPAVNKIAPTIFYSSE